MVGTKDPGGSALERLRQFGLRYPGAHTKSPWPGHLDLAVNDKTFAYLSIAGEPLTISCKLPRSSDAALELPFTTPTAYGLGKSGWVTATFPDGTSVPVELLEEWIDESYRAQAPKRLSAGVPPFGASAGIETGEASGISSPRQASKATKTSRATMASRATKASNVSNAATKASRATKASNGSIARAVKAPKRAAARVSKAKGDAPRPGRSQRAAAPVGARSRPTAKREGVRPRTKKRPSKKRARRSD